MALAVLVVEVEYEPDASGAAAVLTEAMVEVREKLIERDVPVRRAWAGIDSTAEAVATLHGG